ncbi:MULTISPECIES: DUF3710 domain-containing protein [Trueperella]|uniref:DUF3710 domain-containing protein n=1 Tax=Trueperella bernardiae TaxID=59561 RepID=A0A0W1KMQ7_9ACTO|nr:MULTISPECIES: DUF3710 domain-containing protein [Trueperella]KTF04919.1 hypothetical protein AQZ59_00222 [Trueperella bernardiae]OFS68646.1 hypothetical protein HMPREF3174_01550 [Trueperella sp. HMSC08H06]
MVWPFGKKKQVVGADAVVDEAEVEAAVEAPTVGPFDAGDVAIGKRLDAGSLWIPVIPDTTLQFTLDRRREQVLGIVYSKNSSALQLQVFAAPRSAKLWDDVRRDMRTSIANQGGFSQEVEGPLGPELHAQMPVPNSKAMAPHRFLGVDGPRWLLRATLYGKAGSDEAAANEMIEIVRDVVVNRGQAPHPPRELLPLEIPEQVTAQE